MEQNVYFENTSIDYNIRIIKLEVSRRNSEKKKVDLLPKNRSFEPH